MNTQNPAPAHAATLAPTTAPALHAQLSAGRGRWHPEYRERLVSHLPMAQHALWALGADAAALTAFEQAQRDHLEPLAQPWPAPQRQPDWHALRGQPQALPALVAHFDAALAEDFDATLREALPALLDSSAHMALHLLIRAGHALQSDPQGQHGELALALGYWAARHQPLLPGVNWETLAEGDLEPSEWLAGIRALPLPTPLPQGLISDRMFGWAAQPGFQAAALRLRLGDPAATLQQLAQWLAKAYASSGNFTLLHGLTSTRALRHLLPWLTDARPAVRALSVDLAAALRASNWLGELQAPSGPLPDWAELRSRAQTERDEHRIKLVHAALDWALHSEGQNAPNDQPLPLPSHAPSVWRDAAARALQD